MISKFEFDLQFFGGGKGGGDTSSQQYRKRDPEEPELTSLRQGLYGAIMPNLTNYDPSQWTAAQQTADSALGSAQGLLGQIGDYINQSSKQSGEWSSKLDNWLGKTDSLLGENANWLGRTEDWMNQAQPIVGQNQATLAENRNRLNGISDEMLNVVRTGQVPQALTDSMLATINRGLQTGMGASLNDLGNRGVLNSSITGTALSSLGTKAANAMQVGSLDIYNSLLGGYGSALQGAQGNAALDIQGMGQIQNSLGNLLSGIQTGQGGVQTGLGGVQGAMSGVTAGQNAATGSTSAIMNALTGGANAYNNIANQAFTNAGAALMPAYNLWKDAQTLYNNREDFDTVVTQNPGKK